VNNFLTAHQQVLQKCTGIIKSTIFTGSTAHSTTRQYLIYSEADFEVVGPTGATHCTDAMTVKFGMEEGPKVSSSMPNFTPIGAGGDQRVGPLLHAKLHPHRCNDNGIGPPKLKFLLRCDQTVEYKRPAGAYPLNTIFKKFAEFVPRFRIR